MDSVRERLPVDTAPRLERDGFTWALYLLFGFVGTIPAGLGPSLDGLRNELSLSHAETSLHGSLFAVGWLITGMFGDRLIRILGLRRTLSTAVVATALGMVVLCLGKVLLLTLSGVLIIGIGMSLQVVVVTTMLSVRHGRMRGAALSEVNSIASGVGALTPLAIGVSVGAGFTWRLGYGVWPVAAVPIFLCLSRIKAIPDAAFVLAPPDRSRLPRRFWILWLVLVCAVSIEFGVALWAATFLSERFATSQSVASAAFAAFPLGMVVGRMAAARLALTRPARGLILSSLLTCAGGFVLFWLSPFALTSVVGLLVTGLGVGPLYPLTIGLAISDAPSLAAAAASRGMLANGLAISISSFALGALADMTGLERAYGIVLVFIGIAAVLLVTVRPQSSPA